MTKSDLWHSKEGFGSTLLIACIDDFGTECLTWEPETLEISLREKYGDIDIDSLQRVLAAISVLTSNMFTQDVSALCLVCTALDFERTANEMFVPAGLDEIMWGLTEARVLLGGIDDSEFSDEVRIYIAKLLEEEGLKKPPKILAFALKNTATLDLGVLADLPDLSAIFEEDQEMSKAELDDAAMGKLAKMMEQINDLKLTTSDLSDFKEIFNRMRGLNAGH